jgi:hypothetical protein
VSGDTPTFGLIPSFLALIHSLHPMDIVPCMLAVLLRTLIIPESVRLSCFSLFWSHPIILGFLWFFILSYRSTTSPGNLTLCRRGALPSR